MLWELPQAINNKATNANVTVARAMITRSIRTTSSSFNHPVQGLSGALVYAVRMDWVAGDVVLAVIPPRPVNREMNTLDEAGVDALLQGAKDTPYYYLFHLAVYTGLRRSELLGLR